MTIAEFNAALDAEVRARLLGCVAIESWAATLTRERPFRDTGALLARARELAADWTTAEVEGALADHPRIGEKPTATSRAEQAGVGDELREALAEANRRYEERFGRIYLVRAAGRTGPELLALLKERLTNDPDTELEVTRDQLGEIALLRLEGILAA